MPVNMQVILADYAVAHDGKLMMAGAGWSQVGAAPFASALAFIVKVPWDTTPARVVIRAELVDEDGRGVMMNGAPIALEIALDVGRPDGARPGADVDQNVAVQIPQLQLPSGRSYEWRVTVDGEHNRDWNRSFFVRP